MRKIFEPDTSISKPNYSRFVGQKLKLTVWLSTVYVDVLLNVVSNVVTVVIL
jgi:hypothetical protein